MFLIIVEGIKMSLPCATFTPVASLLGHICLHNKWNSSWVPTNLAHTKTPYMMGSCCLRTQCMQEKTAKAKCCHFNLITLLIMAAMEKLFSLPLKSCLIMRPVSSCLADSLSVHDWRLSEEWKHIFWYKLMRRIHLFSSIKVGKWFNQVHCN